MVTLEKTIHPKVTGAKKESSASPSKTEFRVHGQEMIEKRVKTSGRTGRVYLPGDWVGKQVKIIRID